MCLRAIKTKHYSCSAYLSSVSWAITLTYSLNRLSSLQNLIRRKGGKFDHRPERPKVLLRHCFHARTHGLDGQHQDVDRTPRGRVSRNDRGQRDTSELSEGWVNRGGSQNVRTGSKRQTYPISVGMKRNNPFTWE